MRFGTALVVLPSVVIALFSSACVSEAEPKQDRFDGKEVPARAADDVVADPANPGDDQDGPVLGDTGDDPATTPLVDRSGTTTGTTTCEAPRNLGAIAGDVDGTPRTERGTCSDWLRLRVTEEDNASYSAWANDLKLRLTLSSPAGADFDLHVYLDEEQDVVACTTEFAKSEAPANRSDLVELSWGETGWTANAGDDSRTLSIEVRAKDPSSCGKGEWVLTLEGNR